MEYKVSIIIISDLLNRTEELTDLVRQKTVYRLTSCTFKEALERSQRKRIDIIVLSASLFNESNYVFIERFFALHTSAVPVFVIKDDQKDVLNKIDFSPFISLNNDFIAAEFLSALANANEIGKLKNKITKDRGEIIRLLYQLEKMRGQSASGQDNDISSIDFQNTKLTVDDANLADDLAISGSLAKVFNQINNFNLKKIAATLEKELPSVLKIHKFSIFLLKNRLSKLELYASYNFPIQKKTELAINSLMESSIMLDAIFQRKVIHVNDYSTAQFTRNQDNSNVYEHNNCLCIPLVSGKKIIGVANFNDSQYGHFSSQQVNLILIFANYLAVILDNLQKKA